MNYLVIIPARGGSKGIKDKNIIDVNGRPLIAYTIEVATAFKKKNLVDRVIVSTDSEKIAQISLAEGAEVPFIRPNDIAGDNAKTVDVVLHAIEFYRSQNVFYNSIILLQPTSPLRTKGDLQKALQIFENNNADSLISCTSDEALNDMILYHRSFVHAIPFNPNHNKGTRRQDSEKIFIRNGAIYITTVEYLLSEKELISNKPLLLEMPKTRSINIDTKEDIELLIALMSDN